MNDDETLEALLARAARLAAANGVPLDGFMQAAWNAYTETNPQVLEQLEAMHLVGHLQALRMMGRLPSA